MHRYVVFAISVFALGVAARSAWNIGWYSIAFIALLIAVVVLLSPSSIRKKVVIMFLVALVSFGLGVVRMHVAIPDSGENTFVVGGEITLVGSVKREPDIRDTYTNLLIEIPETSERVLVRTDSFTQFLYKDTIQVTGIVEAVTNFEGGGGRIFNYRGYLAKDRVYFILPFPEVTILENNSTAVGHLLKLKGIYLKSLKRMLPEPSAALAGGITVGERRSLGEQLTEDFRATGLIHIIVLSGYNIAIIVIAISILLSFLPPKPRFSLAIVVIVLFTLLVGASATVVRAAIMGSIAAVGAMAGRTYSALNALLFAGLAMLLWNPYLLVFDPSFQLSFVATLGLLFGVPLLIPLLTWIPNKFGMRELTAATISTQIAVYPLLMYMMGEVSLVALPVNLLVLPIIPFAMLAVFIVGVMGSVSVTFTLPFSFLAHGSLMYVFKIVEIFAALSFSTVSVPIFSIWYVFLVYVFLGVGVWLLNKRQRKSDPLMHSA